MCLIVNDVLLDYMHIYDVRTVHIYLVRIWQMIHSVAVLCASVSVSVVAFVPMKIFMQTSAKRRKIEGLFLVYSNCAAQIHGHT